jgi:hypothetical protein
MSNSNKSNSEFSQFSEFNSDETFEAASKSTKRKLAPLLAFLLLLVGGTYLVQTTLAANISLNTGNPVEFGQGVTATSACSGATNLTITPNSTFTNVSGSGAHYFSSVTVSNIPSGCYEKDFTINAYGNTDASPLALFNSTSKSVVVYNNAGTFELGAGSLSGASITSGSGTFTVTFTEPVATSGSVFKITMQSGGHTVVTCATGGSCIVGNTGPGGGKVFYVAGSPFACGPTLGATCLYLEAQLADVVGEACEAGSIAGNSGSANLNTNGAYNTIGAGYQSTLVITDVCSAGAAASSRTIVGGTSDWYLPNRAELSALYSQRATVGGFGTSNYWASWTNTTQFRAMNFSDGYPDNSYNKGEIFPSRAIRAF